MAEAFVSAPSAADPRTLMLYDANKKSAGIAYLLWFFVGLLGGHRFYAGRSGSGACLAVLSILSFLTTFIAIGFVGLLVVGVWVLVDAFLIPGMIQHHNNQLIQRLGF